MPYISQRRLLSIWSEVSVLRFIECFVRELTEFLFVFFSDATLFTHRKKHWPITDKLPLITHAYSNNSKIAWRRWVCRRVRIARHRPLARSHRPWRMLRIKAETEVSSLINRAQRASLRTLLVHHTAQSLTWLRSRHHQQISSSSHSLSSTIIINSNSSRSSTPTWWSKCRFQKNACRSSTKWARPSTRWIFWRFKKWFSFPLQRFF